MKQHQIELKFVSIMKMEFTHVALWWGENVKIMFFHSLVTTVITTYYIFLFFWLLLSLYRFFNDANDINFDDVCKGIWRVSWNEGYDVITFVHDVMKKTFMKWHKSYCQFGCNQRCVTLVFLYDKWFVVFLYLKNWFFPRPALVQFQ